MLWPFLRLLIVGIAAIVIGSCWGRNSASNQALYQNGYRVVWIRLEEEHNTDDLLNLGLGVDIWEVKEQCVIARATDDAIRVLRRKGYFVAILYVTEADYLTSVADGNELPQVVRVNCTTKQRYRALYESGMVSGFVEQTEQYVIVWVTGRQLASLLEQGYDVYPLCVTGENR